jgi:hypothetical protein
LSTQHTMMTLRLKTSPTNHSWVLH